MDNTNKVNGFLKKYSMDIDHIDVEGCVNDLFAEMENGLSGEASSLAMIPTYIGDSFTCPSDKTITVIDAGGTNLRIANVNFNKSGETTVKNLVRYPMLGTQGKINKEQFFNQLADYVLPVLKDNDNIGFCFSYAVDMEPNGDGRLIHFCKEVKVDGIEGELIGKNLVDTLKNKGYTGKGKIVILNDTVATLLSGMAADASIAFSSYSGFILGTGLNACYIEHTTAISKLKSNAFASDGMVINCELGQYTKIPRSIIDKKFDATTNKPGNFLFEKCISGAYLGKLSLMLIKQAAKYDLFSQETQETINQINELETYQISEVLQHQVSSDNPLRNCLLEEDAQTIRSLIGAVVERAALFAAIALCAVVIKSGNGQDEEAPVCITVEGTTFYKLHGLKEKIIKYLDLYLVDHFHRYYRLKNVNDATLLGSAIAGSML